MTEMGEDVADTELVCSKMTRQQNTRRLTKVTECHLLKSEPGSKGNTSKHRRSRVDSGLLSDPHEQPDQSKQDIRNSVGADTSDLGCASPNQSLNSPDIHDTRRLPQSSSKKRNACVVSSKTHQSAPHRHISTSLRSSLSPLPQTPSRAGQGWFSQLGGVTPVSVSSKMCGVLSTSTMSSPASVTKRNVRGETLLHLAAIKVCLIV